MYPACTIKGANLHPYSENVAHCTFKGAKVLPGCKLADEVAAKETTRTV